MNAEEREDITRLAAHALEVMGKLGPVAVLRLAESALCLLHPGADEAHQCEVPRAIERAQPLRWISAAAAKPEHERLVVVWAEAHKFSDWYRGYWDETCQCWRDENDFCVSQALFPITHWAYVSGPAC